MASGNSFVHRFLKKDLHDIEFKYHNVKSSYEFEACDIEDIDKPYKNMYLLFDNTEEDRSNKEEAIGNDCLLDDDSDESTEDSMVDESSDSEDGLFHLSKAPMNNKTSQVKQYSSSFHISSKKKGMCSPENYKRQKLDTSSNSSTLPLHWANANKTSTNELNANEKMKTRRNNDLKIREQMKRKKKV